MTWIGFLIRFFFFFASTERNDQTEQEERREIKQRLNRKVPFIFIPLNTHAKRKLGWFCLSSPRLRLFHVYSAFGLIPDPTQVSQSTPFGSPNVAQTVTL